jgi:murein DD-endopeptidase MepM/ murein hydrolase activator NlpD
MTHVSRRRHVAALVFATTCGFLAGMAVMAVLTLVFRAETPVPAAILDAVTPRTEARHLDARPAVNDASPSAAAVPDVTIGDAPELADDPPDLDDAVQDLRRRRLDVPIGTIERAALRGSFDEARDGSRRHEAMDLLAPRHTPVVAVEAGIIARLFTSKAGGITVYQFDPTTTYAYYYAHLERYAPGLEEGATVSRGQVLGYVGTSGNAPKDTPHLHFAIFVLDDDKRWWQGTPIDPFLVLSP